MIHFRETAKHEKNLQKKKKQIIFISVGVLMIGKERNRYVFPNASPYLLKVILAFLKKKNFIL